MDAALLAGLLLVCGEPRVEVDLPDAGALARCQLAAVQLRAVAPSVRVGDDCPVIAGGREQPPRPGVDAQRVGAAQLHPTTATSSAATNWISPVDSRTLSPSAPASTIWGRKNCVARRMV